MELAKTIAIELQRLPTWAKNLLIVTAASLILCLFSQIAIPLPFTPIPIALQNGVVVLFGVLLGSKRAPAAVAAFLAQGAAGLPVFANGLGGISILLGPKGGYLIGYLVASYVTAKIVEKLPRGSLKSTLIAMVAGYSTILVMGAAWLATFVGPANAVLMGVAPFLLGDAIKIALSAKLLHWLGFRERS